MWRGAAISGPIVRRGRIVWWTCVVALPLFVGAALGHVVYQRRTLRQWAQQADLIVVAEILSPLRVWSAADGSDHQEYFSLRVVESVAGDPPSAAFDVFPHAEGAPRYAVGDTVMLFLDRTAERAEFAHLARRFPYFTTQGAGHEWKITAADDTIPSIARAWRAEAGVGNYAAHRDLLIRQLETRHQQLRAEGIADLVLLSSSSAFRSDSEGIARLTAMLASHRLLIVERIGLIRALDGLAGFSGAEALLDLAAEVNDPADRIAVTRALGSATGEAVTEWLRAQLKAADPAVQIATLISLGAPRHASAVPDIAVLATSAESEPRVAHSAIRALGAIGDQRAASVLRGLAVLDGGSLPGLARAELTALDRRRRQNAR